MVVNDRIRAKRYGIYLDWGPTNYLRTEGIGRQLAAFLKAAAERPDVKFVVACPSWGREQLDELCEAEQVPRSHFEVLSPKRLPLSLRVYNAHQKRKLRKKSVSNFWIWFRSICAGVARLQMRIERRLVSTRSLVEMTSLILILTPVGLVFVPLRLLMAGGRLTKRAAVRWTVVGYHRLGMRLDLSNKPLLQRFRRHLEQTESDLLASMINARQGIEAWYCPTAFWPQFNRLKAPRLMCVPDVVLTEFPVGFEFAEGKALFDRFCQVQDAIRGASHCLTYSQHTKWQTVVKRYDISADAVYVVPHAAQNLLESIHVSGTANDQAATDLFCRQMLTLAFRSAPNPAYAIPFKNEYVEFIFYASQFRPNKNVLTLLRAFEYLLRQRYKGMKLILTGQPEYREVAQFVQAKNLTQDVLFLSDLPLQQLAACYRLARLAVNPSLSEGGFPFTFSEALSVGTPVVMSRIPVTEEVITDPKLQSMMLFDPYDWWDMANRIEWALSNRQEMLAQQKPVYEQLAQRTWRHVVDEHVEILDRIASEGLRSAAKT